MKQTLPRYDAEHHPLCLEVGLPLLEHQRHREAARLEPIAQQEWQARWSRPAMPLELLLNGTPEIDAEGALPKSSKAT